MSQPRYTVTRLRCDTALSAQALGSLCAQALGPDRKVQLHHVTVTGPSGYLTSCCRLIACRESCRVTSGHLFSSHVMSMSRSFITCHDTFCHITSRHIP